MQCTRCHSSMQLVKRENHQDSYLEWHQCPLCQRMEFLSQPVRHRGDAMPNVTDDFMQHPAGFA